MRVRLALAITVAVVLLCLPVPAGAAPPEQLPGPSAGLPAQAKAYGRYCKDQSKKRAEGERGTPFSQCVKAMAKLAKGKADSPRQACKDLSRKHVVGEQGTPFSRCVRGAKRLLEDLEAS